MCPVCLGAYTWKEDLLHHFGAVHHLEELVAHLESLEQFSAETCFSCCRVPETLFKNLLSESTQRIIPSSWSVGNGGEESRFSTATKAESPTDKVSHSGSLHADADGGSKESEGGHSPPKCANVGSATKKLESRGGSPQHANVGGGTKQSERRSSRDDFVRSIERYHCEMCEFGANDIWQLDEHCSSEHCYQNTPLPSSTPIPDELFERFSTDAADDGSYQEQAKGRFVCNFCPYVAKSRIHLTRHVDVHRRSAFVTVGYKCGYCNMANSERAPIKRHLSYCHNDQPLKILRIDDSKVIDDDPAGHDSSISETVTSKLSSTLSHKVVDSSINLDSMSKTAKFKFTSLLSNEPVDSSIGFKSPVSKTATSKSPLKSPGGSAVKKHQNESKSPKSKVSSDKRDSSIILNKQALDLTSSLNTDDEVLNSSRETSVEALVSRLPAGRMVYWQPVQCPLCNYSSCAQVNLVRHIRLTHVGNSQQSVTSAQSDVTSDNSANGDNVLHCDKSFTQPLQV